MSDAARPDFSKPYEPREVEAHWYAFWEREGVFEAHDDAADTRPVYVVPMPPPEDMQGTFVRSDRKIGRNEPCPCGSGKKFKNCHGALSGLG